MIANPLSPNAPNSPPNGAAYKASRLTPVDPLRVLRQYMGVIAIAVVLGVVVGVGLWFLLVRYAPRYTSVAQLTITGGISDPYQLLQQSGGVGTLNSGLVDTFIMNQIIRIRSDEVFDGALKRDDVRMTSWFRSFKGDTRAARTQLQRDLAAIRIKGSTLISVSFSANNEKDPPVIVDAVIGVYLEKLSLESGRESDDVRRAFVRERDRAEENLRQIEEQLKQFKIRNDLPAIETRNHEITITYKALAEQRMDLEMRLEIYNELYPSLLNAQVGGTSTYSPQQLAASEADPSVAARNERLLNLREQREVLMERFGSKHRMVRQIDLQILAAEEEKKRQVDRLLRKGAAVQLEQTKQAIDSLGSQLESLQPKMADAHAQLRDLGLRLDEYARIKERAEAAFGRRAKVDELLNSMRIQNDRPDSTQVREVFRATQAELTFPVIFLIVPSVTIFLTGLVLGVVFLKESFDQRIKSPSDMTLLPACHFLGVIPDAAEDPSKPTYVEGIVRVNPAGLMAESFRQVRAAMSIPIQQHGHKVLLLTSAQPGCGTSVVANNLAISMAYEGKKVLLVDANYRQPAQHKLFGATIEPGLIDVLLDTIQFEDAVVHIDTPELDILPVGRVSDAMPEMFEGAAFSGLLNQLRDKYDVVMIDAPPVLLAMDSLLMAKHVDAVAVVVRAMADMRGMVSRMLRQLGDQQVNVLGIVLNGVRSSAGGYFRKNYQAFYRYRQPGEDPPAKREADEEFIEAVVDE